MASYIFCVIDWSGRDFRCFNVNMNVPGSDWECRIIVWCCCGHVLDLLVTEENWWMLNVHRITWFVIVNLNILFHPQSQSVYIYFQHFIWILITQVSSPRASDLLQYNKLRPITIRASTLNADSNSKISRKHIDCISYLLK